MKRRKIFLISFCILSSTTAAPFIYTIDLSPFLKDRIDNTIKVKVESISYLGKDDYKIEVSLLNKSARPIFIKKIDRQFYAQTDKGWKLLSDRSFEKSTDSADPQVSAEGKKKVVSVVNIPLDIPALFRTYEGDISLVFKCTLQIITYPENIVNKFIEQYYWVTPMTDRWIHREGM